LQFKTSLRDFGRHWYGQREIQEASHATSLLDGTRTAIELALEDDTSALRFCLEQILPQRKSRKIAIEVPRASLRIEGRTLKTFHGHAETGRAVQRLFCGNCGSPIVSYSDGLPGVAFIKAGTLEDTSWLKPTTEIWCETAQPLVVIDLSRTRASRNSPRGRERRGGSAA
jgi:Uncharacterized conserved protein